MEHTGVEGAEEQTNWGVLEGESVGLAEEGEERTETTTTQTFPFLQDFRTLEEVAEVQLVLVPLLEEAPASS